MLAALLFGAWWFAGLPAFVAVAILVAVALTAALASRRHPGTLVTVAAEQAPPPAGRRFGGPSCRRRAGRHDHLRRRGGRRPRQPGRGRRIRTDRQGHSAAAPVAGARNAAADRRPALRQARKLGGRLCRTSADRTRLPGHRDPHRRRGLVVRAGLQGPERDAPHRPHAGRLHRQCQPRAAHAARLDRRFRRDAEGAGARRRRGARQFSEDHAGTDRPHGTADRRPPVAVAAGDEAVPAAGSRGRPAPDDRQRHRFARTARPGGRCRGHQGISGRPG